MAVVDIACQFLEVNEAFLRIVGRRAGLVGTGLDEISHPDDLERHAGLRLGLLRTPDDLAGAVGELRLVRADGRVASTVVTWCLLGTGEGSPARFLAQVVDVTEREQTAVTRARAEDLRARADQHRMALVPDPDAGLAPEKQLDVLLVEDDDAHARLVAETLALGFGTAYRLRRAHDLAGARAELDLGPTDCILLDLFLPDGQGLESLRQLTTLAPLVPIVILTSLADEQLGLLAVHEGAQDYLVKGTIDGPRLARALRHAIERKALQARFAEQALHDPLTGLANRTLLFDRLRLEIARTGRSGFGVAVFYLDVDGFKSINDRLGHDAGDEVLVRVAGRLRRLVRPGDTVSRIGGDEFVVVCGGLAPGIDMDRMQARIEETVGRPLQLRGGTELVTASVGMAVAGSTDAPEAVISRADEVMYQAKRRRHEVERTSARLPVVR
jgi:diguanylate cyclase (GGDEF)-like protein/PAS domain S-box-containing protein